MATNGSGVQARIDANKQDDQVFRDEIMDTLVVRSEELRLRGFPGFGRCPFHREGSLEGILPAVRRLRKSRSPSTLSPKGFFLKKVEAAGIEPASRNRSTKASTCVVDCLISLLDSPVDRVVLQPARNFFNRERARR